MTKDWDSPRPRSLVSGEPQTRSAHPAGIKPGPSEAIQSGYADYTPVTVRAHTVPNSAGASQASHRGTSAGESDPVARQDCAPAGTVSALNSQYAGLEALLAAIHADDPKRELLVRVGDLMRENRALLSQFDVRRK